MQLSELNAHRHTAATRSGEISYLDIGAGPVALFVHGIATNAYLWRHVMDALSGQRRCIAVDLPLHGQSPVTAGQEHGDREQPSCLGERCRRAVCPGRLPR